MATTMYAEPTTGTYEFYTRNFNGTLNRFRETVEVVGETARCYLIKAKIFIGSHIPGDVIRVHKSSVYMKPSKPVHDYSNAYWNK